MGKTSQRWVVPADIIPTGGFALEHQPKALGDSACAGIIHTPYGDDIGILSRKGVAGQGIRRCGGLTRLPRIAHFAPGFVSHLRDLRACCIGGDGGGTQMVSQEVFHAQLCQGA